MLEGKEAVEKEQPETPETEPETPATEPEPEGGEGEEKEPGGSDGKAVYERKMHRRAVSAERQLAETREQLARINGELAAFKETAKPAETRKEPTIAEVVEAMEKGTVSAAAGAAYIAKKTAEEAFQQREAREAAQKPIQTAAAQIEEYKVLLPGLADQTHQRFGEVRNEYQRLVAQLGLPQNTATELLAVEHVFGRIDQLKAKRNMDKTDRESARFHAETGGGGTASQNGKSDWQKASKDQIAMWDKLGTSEKDRKIEWEFIKAREARRGRAA